MSGIRVLYIVLMLGVAPLFLLGCGEEAEIYPPNEIYRLTVVNLTHNQLFSPYAAIAHTEGYTGWEVDKSASVELERLAESGAVERPEDEPAGDSTWFLDEAAKKSAVVATAVASQFVDGGGRWQLDLSVPPDRDYRLTLATNLVYTNDGFTGVTNLAIGQLAVGEELSVYAQAYDAGTEENTETEATVPGFVDFETDADGNLVLDENGDPVQIAGFGFDPSRLNDANIINIHPGVISADEPVTLDAAGEAIKANSALDSGHRFLQPVAKIVVERVI